MAKIVMKLFRYSRKFLVSKLFCIIRVEKDIEVISKPHKQLCKKFIQAKKRFRITTKRSDHDFIQDTNELNLTLGNAIVDIFPDIKAQMKQQVLN